MNRRSKYRKKEERRKKKLEKKRQEKLSKLVDRTKYTTKELREKAERQAEISRRRRHKETIKIKVGFEYKDK